MIELAGILVLGIFAQWLAWKIKQPAISPLIIIGLLIGPVSSIFHPEGEKLIDPQNIFNPDTDYMFYFISLSVGIILFEGSLTLKMKEIRQHGTTVRNLLTIGALITFVGAALSTWLILGLDIRIALLFGGLIIVTGPTVIAPILRNVHPSKNIATVLKWESILIDPLGAFVAVLIYEFIVISTDAGSGNYVNLLESFFFTIFSGALVGYLAAQLLRYILNNNQFPEYLTNVGTLAIVVAAFAISDFIQDESGLLAVTLMGLVLANMSIKQITAIANFKESITVLLISILFIILAANMDVAHLEMIDGRSLVILFIVIVVLRPLGVFLSSRGTKLTLQEKIFISWIGPRGIVAAAVASLFALTLADRATLSPKVQEQAEFLLPLTFLIILGTVILQGSTAKVMAKLLGVIKTDPKGFLLFGSNEASRLIAKYMRKNGVPHLLIDSSSSQVNEAIAMDLRAMQANVLSEEFWDDLEEEDIGKMLALDSSNDLNIFACRMFRKAYGDSSSFRLITMNELKFSTLMRPDYVLFDPAVDYLQFIEIARHYPTIDEMELKDEADMKEVLSQKFAYAIPLFLRSKDNRLKPLPANHNVTYEPGDVFVFMGEMEK